MNKVILVGRLTKDPSFKTTSGGKSVCTFTVAVDRRFKQEGQPTADFIPVIAWGRQAEILNQYFSKGRQIALCGRMQVRHYDDKEGITRYVTEVVLEEFDFIGSNSGNGTGETKEEDQGNNFEVPEDDFSIENDEEVPF